MHRSYPHHSSIALRCADRKECCPRAFGGSTVPTLSDKLRWAGSQVCTLYSSSLPEQTTPSFGIMSAAGFSEALAVSRACTDVAAAWQGDGGASSLANGNPTLMASNRTATLMGHYTDMALESRQIQALLTNTRALLAPHRLRPEPDAVERETAHARIMAHVTE